MKNALIQFDSFANLVFDLVYLNSAGNVSSHQTSTVNCRMSNMCRFAIQTYFFA